VPASGQQLAPRGHYENGVAAFYAAQGYTHWAELVEAGHACAACHVTHNIGHIPTNQELDLGRYNTVANTMFVSRAVLEFVLAVGGARAGYEPNPSGASTTTTGRPPLAPTAEVPPPTTAAGNGGGGTSPSFIATAEGEVIIVPKGASGPTPVVNPQARVTGSAYTGGSGGQGLDPRVTSVRVMNPTPPAGPSPGYPGGYVVYQNAARQTVNPFSGQTVPRADPFAHIPLKPP
jgi:hypothetical protein